MGTLSLDGGALSAVVDLLAVFVDALPAQVGLIVVHSKNITWKVLHLSYISGHKSLPPHSTSASPVHQMGLLGAVKFSHLMVRAPIASTTGTYR